MLNGGLLLGSCGFVYQDGAYDEALKRLPSLSNSWGALQPAGIHQYAGSRPVGSARAKLTSFLDVLRLTPYRLALLKAGDFLHSPLMDGYAVTGLSAPRTADDLAFDKAVIRGLLPESVYLLLQGFSGTSLSTIDMNSIIRYTDLGKLWLVHNTGRRSLYYKNGVHVSSGVDDSRHSGGMRIARSGRLRRLGDGREPPARLSGSRLDAVSVRLVESLHPGHGPPAIREARQLRGKLQLANARLRLVAGGDLGIHSG